MKNALKITKTTPILCVKSIEESLPLWINMLGYEKTMEVMHKDKLGFVMLVQGGHEIMLQTHASVLDDLPKIADSFRPGTICLYSDVDSIEKTIENLKGVKILVPLRSTPYGAREVWVQDLDGNVLGFAEFKKA
ncbi:MAG: hypothetical protein A2X86_08310 [Bdellovibrionales bacterium GWA2_49_15]|nr:MAG: hypothetical protein A2X86_08310 [Bdellovibrionales bacterium GWA2_49_15]HAZ11236.1 hypothetical protein [Bdellovibrionales bacterium]